MAYKQKASRDQIMLLPDSIDEYIGEDNPVRVIDAFVDGLDMTALSFTKSTPADTGCPAYSPSDLLKLYIYGYYNRIRSSRKLMIENGRNVELMWLMGKLQPDFRTISDFRKENAKSLKLVFKEFVKLCDKLKLYSKDLIAIDGTKIRAQNSNDKCFNESILHKKIANIDNHISEYLNSMDKTDAKEVDDESLTAEQVKVALKELTERKEKYEGYLEYLKISGETQILETDTEARRMHSRNGFHCHYNVQTAVDSSHLIAGYEVTNRNNDQGLLHMVSQQVKETLDVETIEVVGDKGYESRIDILNCLMNGTVPNTGHKIDRKERIFNLDYEEADITEEIRASTKPEDIQKCLHAGVLPKCYENTAVSVELQGQAIIGCFTNNFDDTVTCPMGQTLWKTKTKGVNTVYASREACRLCPNRCTPSSKNHKTVLFGPATTHVATWMYGSGHHEVIRPPDYHVYHNAFFVKKPVEKKVVVRIREDKEKQKLRMCLSEHPFGTVKWYHGANHFLCRGKEKTSGEMGLSFLAYNLRRAITLVGVPALIAVARG
jgi:transposase